jgi:hypothetical protein
MILQLDFTYLKERLRVCVLRDVCHDFLCVRSEARLKGLNRVEEEMASCYVWCRRFRLLARNPVLDRNSLSKLIPVAVEPSACAD